ncbi:MAG: D-alanyl-D-alanine carboxypeptidase family protein [Rhizobiaceae bacterium]
MSEAIRPFLKMLRNFSQLAASMLAISLTLSPFTVSPLAAAPHIVVDLDSGQVLSDQQAFDPWHPASLTKLMTAYSVFRAITNGSARADQAVRISRNAAKQPPSRIGYRVGTTMTLDNALKLLLVKSANDVSVAIAESVSGSVPRFAQQMTRDARQLGMSGSQFVNPHGLHDRRQVTTARDMALLVQALHKTYPQYRAMFETPSVLAPRRTKNGKTIQRLYYSYNLLLERYRGADGFKTGFVCASGYNFIGSATRSGRRIAAVVMGRDSQTSRAVDAAKLMTEGFQQPLNAGQPIDKLQPGGAVPTGPRNMRNTICTQQARAARYEPGAGQAVIESPWLLKREITRSPLQVSLLGRATALAALARVPLPNFRPASAIQPTKLEPVEPVAKVAEVGKSPIPLPSFRPSS